ncbi:hypothetical protein ABB37_07914 [Leptomonas pyrrhocoris]|uniref:Uncharacterized protein n=1 Tax=Leptomonas pyrrhocoris TaxID=157538 RepID=A0A0N0DSM2_LEPPY|nr:hypothetical protein ABB37_07914 [Leptomonas pyrrhocoris]KPA76148.1 hypothetical protein ABB37_07914 [Leptomonas pyrrhocoris]|eukprot:XP_015654587.1 hypothetical protein ABB37_07914 [Leptomonas pyrrhocoris]
MGIQGSGKTSFMLGNVQGGDAAPPRTLSAPPPRPSAATAASSSPLSAAPATGGLFRAVMDRLFATEQHTRSLSVAVSVVEVRDVAPLQHPSVLQRPRETVDLLSGQLLSRQEGQHEEGTAVLRRVDRRRRESSPDEDGSSGSATPSVAVDEPTDIPAACYVRVHSSAAAARVLYTALRSSTAWQPRLDTNVSETVGPADARHPSSPPVSCLLRPAGLPREEQTSHLCVTTLVSHAGDARRGWQATTPPAVGIWKLWDVSGPDPSCGYRPYTAGDANDASTPPPPLRNKKTTRRTHAQVEERDPLERDRADTQWKPALPWHNRYSLPSLTHTCLTAFGCGADRPARCDLSLLRCDATALQIAASATESCSLVIPVCTVVAAASADEVNAEVLRCAGGWAAFGRRADAPVLEGEGRATQTAERSRGADNAAAAQRVLEDYAVPFEDFFRENIAPCASAVPPTLWEASCTPGASDGGAGVGAPAICDTSATFARNPSTFSSTTAPLRTAPEARRVDGRVPLPVSSGVPGDRTAPLSINVTASEEDQLTTLPAVAYSKDRSDALADRAAALASGLTPVKEEEKSSREEGTCSVSQRSPLHGKRTENLVRTPQRLGNESAMAAAKPAAAMATTMSTLSTQPSVAALCAAGAMKAEEARLQRFEGVFETETFDVADEPPWTSHAVPALNEAEDGVFPVSLPSAEAKPVGLRAGERRQQSEQAPLHTPVKQDSSPPSVMRTALRPPASAAPPPPLPLPSESGRRGAAGPPPPPSPPPPVAAEPTDKEETFLCTPQELRYDTSELPPPRDGQRAALTVDSAAASRANPTTNPDPAAAAVVQYLAPYCDQFLQLYADMRRDVATWRAAEVASLQTLSELAEQHTRDIQRLTQLLRQLSAPAANRSLDGGAVSSAPVTSSGDAAAALASTSSLIFEQLVKSEEKVTWLEKQLVQWRQRTHEASTLHHSIAEVGDASALVDDHKAELTIGLFAIDSQGLHASALSEGDDFVKDDGADPTGRHVAQAQRILHRLLQRCGRAYASAQERSTRWQEQLTQEHASKSALMDRMTELEGELAEYRRRGGAVLAALPPGSSHAEAGTPDRHRGASAASRTTPLNCPDDPLLYSGAVLTAFDRRSDPKHVKRTEEEGEEQLIPINMRREDKEELIRYTRAALTCATPAQVSPIRSLDDTVLSLPSQAADRGRGRTAAAQTTPVPEEERHPASSSAASSTSRPSVAADVPSQLAALLSRAVGRDDESGGFPSNRRAGRPHLPPSSTAAAAAAAALFDVRFGPASSTAAEASVQVAVDSDAEEAPHLFNAASPPSPFTRSAATPRANSERLHEAITQPGVRQGATRSAARTHGAVTVADELHGTGPRDDSYPTVALQRLQRAATQLAANAVRLTRLADPNDESAGTTVSSAAQLLRETLEDPRRRPAPAGNDIFTVRSRSSERDADHVMMTPLSQSLGELRSASQAVQREARETAERERAYLSTILFSPVSSPERGNVA